MSPSLSVISRLCARRENMAFGQPTIIKDGTVNLITGHLLCKSRMEEIHHPENERNVFRTIEACLSIRNSAESVVSKIHTTVSKYVYGINKSICLTAGEKHREVVFAF